MMTRLFEEMFRTERNSVDAAISQALAMDLPAVAEAVKCGRIHCISWCDGTEEYFLDNKWIITIKPAQLIEKRDGESIKFTITRDIIRANQ